MTRKEVTKLFKRFLITFLCSLPFLIGLGFLLYEKVSDFVMITIFVVLAGLIFGVEELIHFTAFKKRQLLKEQELDRENAETKKEKSKSKK